MKREYIPIESLPAWQRLSGVVVQGIEVHKIGSDEHGADKGSALIATEAQTSSENDANPKILLQIPPELVLSLETVHNHAKTDRYLRDVLEAIGDFGRTARGAILIFLLIQLSHTSPDLRSGHETIGVSNPWTEYVKFLPPSFPLPTFYTSEEKELLRGTSLAEALDAKLTSLEREFEQLREATEGIAWCQRSWWDEETGALNIDDWKYVDAAYRSRMLELPGSGLAMVPCVDMANHVSGDGVKALYDVDSEGNAVLQLRWGKSLQPGEEVTISYGDEKPASEMIFSYGFLESGTTEARGIVLSLDIPADDPLSLAKKMFCRENPGLRISAVEGSEEVTWESGLAWMACVNEEDGLHFGIAQTTDGGQELETTWKGEKIESASRLRELLTVDPLWDIFQLRAVVLLLERLETQLALLQEMEEIITNLREDEADLDLLFRPGIFASIAQFRTLEGELLERAVEGLIKQRTELLASQTVADYFKAQTGEPDEPEDFS
ncbi:hypothetical protein DTO013E5_988 [Penicillium roqueforti]|nr:hypothetical protein CBS147318_2058 [Penicillium roqueforti]KAI2747719.1 hypothetical protein DTO012A1_365 [Penicillium roqueforti]KAI2751522.1 hypothetical protein DTO013F2_3859 [Penicillium roqueforti]KAI2772666.1 hypothetical protein DTO012A8_2706 [Penicillium roqueforti]KAI3083423.1 hypothetical protein CBS147339_1799 [Penicillium roqueforti]